MAKRSIYCSPAVGIVNFSKFSHYIPLQKHGFTNKNDVSKSIRTHDMPETFTYGKKLAALFTNLAILLVVHYSKCFHSIPHPQKHGFSHAIHVSKSIRTHDMLETLKYGKNWQPCCSYTILSASIRFLDLKNMGLARKIMFLS